VLDVQSYDQTTKQINLHVDVVGPVKSNDTDDDGEQLKTNCSIVCADDINYCRDASQLRRLDTSLRPATETHTDAHHRTIFIFIN